MKLESIKKLSEHTVSHNLLEQIRASECVLLVQRNPQRKREYMAMLDDGTYVFLNERFAGYEVSCRMFYCAKHKEKLNFNALKFVDGQVISQEFYLECINKNPYVKYLERESAGDINGFNCYGVYFKEKPKGNESKRAVYVLLRNNVEI